MQTADIKALSFALWIAMLALLAGSCRAPAPVRPVRLAAPPPRAQPCLLLSDTNYVGNTNVLLQIWGTTDFVTWTLRAAVPAGTPMWCPTNGLPCEFYRQRNFDGTNYSPWR
jgi:hypothetical protein